MFDIHAMLQYSMWKPETCKSSVVWLQWTFLHTWLLSKTPLSSCLGSSRFMRKITGYEQYSEHVHAVNWVLRVIRISECCYARCNAGVCYQRSVPRPFFILDLMRRSVQRSLTCRNPSTSLEQVCMLSQHL
ncbi:TPA: hypothetical protein ACH3X1_005900 [Trebouxia sp. C0004]